MICEAADSLMEMDRATKKQAANCRFSRTFSVLLYFRTRNYSLRVDATPDEGNDMSQRHRE